RTGQWLASARVGGENDHIGIYSVAGGREYRSLIRAGGKQTSSLVFPAAIDPGGRLAAVGHPGGDAHLGRGGAIFDLQSGRKLAETPASTIADGRLNATFDGLGNLLTNSFDGLYRWPVRPDPSRTGQSKLGPPERLSSPRNNGSIATSRDGR